MKQNFASGQEIIFQDLNKISSRLERQFYDRILKKIVADKSDAFFADDFKVLFTGATSVNVNGGLGLQTVASAQAFEPTIQPVYREGSTNLVFETPDNSNGRIDIVVVKAKLIDGQSESRKFKDEFTNVITNANTVVNSEWEAEFMIVKGTASTTPVAPSTPSGYLKIAECTINASTGLGSQSDINDTREILPQSGFTGATGSREFTAIQGDINQVGVTHATLKAALDNVGPGSKILVTQSEAVDAIPQVNQDNIEIVFLKGVTISKNGVTTGLRISANDCKLVNGRFSGFSASGDSGIVIDSGILRTVIEPCNFLNCDSTIIDDGANSYIAVEFEE